MKFMKQFKAGIITCTVLLFTIIPLSQAYALSSTHSNINTMSLSEVEDINRNLKKIEAKYDGVSLDLMNQKSSDVKILFEFKSTEELDLFVQNFKDDLSSNKIIENNEIYVSKDDMQKIADVDTVSWWAPFSKWPMNGMACIKNVVYSYNYEWRNGRPYYTLKPKVTSHKSGINETSWTQTGSAVNLTTKYSTNDTAKSTVSGYYLLGVSVNGAPVGFTVNDTWESSLTLVPK